MKKILFVTALLLMFFAGVQIYSAQTSISSGCMIAARGCCSHHGGVCGCSGGRSRCCDGTLSPSCQCFMDESKGLKL